MSEDRSLGTTTRQSAEARFAQSQKVATEATQSELTAVLSKTARLKALRQEQEAAQEEWPETPARTIRKKP